MKSLQDLYVEAVGSDKEKRAFVEAMKAGTSVDFLKQHGCDATEEELAKFLAGKAAEETALELSEDQLAIVAGGTESLLTQTCACSGDTCECSGTCVRDCC